MTKFFIFVLLSSSLYAEFIDTTVEVAARLNYPQFMNNLRDETTDYLRQTVIGMKLDEQALRSANYMYRANVLQTLDSARLDYLGDRIDREFMRFDIKFLNGAERLDDQDASTKVKAQFVETLKKEARASIIALLRTFVKQECPVCQRMSINLS